MNAKGALIFLLYGHLPYLRHSGAFYSEPWLHEAAAQTYLPLLEMLYNLRDDNITFALSIGLSPVLVEQLADPDVQIRLEAHLDARIAAAENDVLLFARHQQDDHLRFLAGWYRDRYKRLRAAFIERFDRDLIGAFRRLQDEGYIEIIAGAATHAYLPLLSRDSSVRAQIEGGIASYRRHFGRDPVTFWLPECAYRPEIISETGRTRAAFETMLAEYGIRASFVNAHTIMGGEPTGIAGGKVFGLYGDVLRNLMISPETYIVTPERPTSTFRAYDVGGVAFIGRNEFVGQQVWGSEFGYPGDFDYREFGRRSGSSGLRYWRVTNNLLDMAKKELYHPDWAEYKVEQHAEHFVHLAGDQVRWNTNDTGDHGVVLAAFDAALFGQRWLEGIMWLGKVLAWLHLNPDVELTTAARYLETHAPTEALELPESSWGVGGGHFIWDNYDTHWMWTPIHESEERMQRLADRYADTTPDARTTLNQAGRELMLLQASDLQFYVTTNRAREFAIHRFNQHHDAFDRLARSLESGQPDVTFAREMYERDKIFPDMDYRWFRSR